MKDKSLKRKNRMGHGHKDFPMRVSYSKLNKMADRYKKYNAFIKYGTRYK